MTRVDPHIPARRRRHCGTWRGLALGLELAALALPLTAGAGTAALFDRIGVAEGLPNGDVEALARDRFGYVWMATRGGLVRHEGRQLRVLRHDPDRPDALPGNNILALTAAADGDLWAAISGHGIVRLQGTRVVEHWRHRDQDGRLAGEFVWSMAETCDTALWAVYAQDGLARIDPASGTVEHFAAGTRGLTRTGFGLELLVDADCRLWLLRSDGLWRVDTTAPYALEPVLAPAATELQLFTSIALMPDGTLYLGGRNGIVELPPAPSGVAAAERQPARFLATPATVSALAPEGPRRLWVGFPDDLRLIDTAGVGIVDPGAGPLPDGLLQASVVEVMPGVEGEVWVATFGAGVVRLMPGWQGHKAWPLPGAGGIRALRVLDDGEVWLATVDQGVARLDLDQGDLQQVATPRGAAGGSSSLQDLHVDSDWIWSLTRSRLERHRRNGTRVETLLEVGIDQGEWFEFLAATGDGGVWVATQLGVLFRLGADGRVERRWGPDGSGPDRLVDPTLRQMLIGPDGAWWLLGHRTLYRQAADGGFEARLERRADVFARMAFDGEHLWLASDALLERFRLEEGAGLASDLRVTAGGGLPAGQVQGLIPGPRFLWMLTSNALARFDPATSRFRQFTAAGGLMLNEFSAGASAPLPGGGFLAGTRRGVLRVDPDRINAAPRPPPAWITSVRAGAREIAVDPLARAPLRLDWREDSVEFRFVALSYLDPARNRFRVRLAGWEDEWQELVGVDRRLYANLPGGRYRFELQAANADGVWNRDGDALAVHIAVPPWRGPLAITAYALVLLAATGTGWRALAVRRRRSVALERARERQRLADAASAAKSEFLATMSHEIRTPLHGLLGMMDVLERTRGPEDQRELVATMRASGRQLQRILDDILDLSRIESGRVDLEPVAFELVPVLERVVDLHAPNASRKGLALRLRIASGLPVIAVGDPGRIRQVLGNLVNNAIKFTASGAVEVEACTDPRRGLVVAVSDTGPGIDPARQAEMFEPFSRLESAALRRHSGTGLGLAICRRLVEAMGGTLALSSRPGHGSRFSVALPLAGMMPARVPATGLLEGLRLGVVLPAPERRIAWRLARRWRFDCQAIVTPEALAATDVLVCREHCLPPAFGAALDGSARPPVWYLGEPERSAGNEARWLREPLTESRLIGALLDWRLGFSRLG